AELRNALLEACNGNYSPALLTADLSPVKMAVELVGLGRVRFAIFATVDKRSFPGNPPLERWSEPRVLTRIADDFCRLDVVPRLLATWQAAKAPAAKAQSLPPLDPMEDGTDELRGRHDREHSPPGPHVMPQPVGKEATVSP